MGGREVEVARVEDIKKIMSHGVLSTNRSWGGLNKGRRGKMAIKPVLFHLTAEEALKLTRVLLDEDKEEALLFLKECLKPQLDEATRDH
jgi:hypothetical protein